MTGAFDDIDYTQFDAWAIIACAGLVSVRAEDCGEALAWLRERGYLADEFDFSGGIAPVVEALGMALRWDQQFGYFLTRETCNLDALRDGFDWNVPPAPAGRVMVLHAPEVGWQENADSLRGLLSIAREFSRRQLALGRRYFTVLPLAPGSPLPGEVLETLTIAATYSGRWYNIG